MFKKMRVAFLWVVLLAMVIALFGPAVYAGTAADVAKQVYEKWSSGGDTSNSNFLTDNCPGFASHAPNPNAPGYTCGAPITSSQS